MILRSMRKAHTGKLCHSFYYKIIRGSTFTTIFVNRKFWDKINFTESNVAYKYSSERKR